MNKEHKIAVIGLGYVGLPLARLFATKYPVVGFDINTKRIEKLNQGIDDTLEVDNEVLKAVLKPFNNKETGLFNSCDIMDIQDANIYIVTVPTPVDKHNRPDLTPLYKSSETVGKVLQKEVIDMQEQPINAEVTDDECNRSLENI